MSTLWKVLLGLALTLPVAAFVVGSLASSAADEPTPRDPIVISQAPSPTDRPTRTPSPTPSSTADPEPDDEPHDEPDDEPEVVRPEPGDADDRDDDGDDDD